MSEEDLPRGMTFPLTRAVLWNRSPSYADNVNHEPLQLTPPMFLATITKQSVKLCAAASKGFLVGGCILEEGVFTVAIDRFDPGKVDEFGERVPTVCMPGEVAIPVKDADAISDAFEFEEVCDRIEKYTRSCVKMDPCRVFHVMAFCKTLKSVEESVSWCLEVQAVRPEFAFQLIPINRLPVVRTALARKVYAVVDPQRTFDPQTEGGLVTMDSSRSVVLIDERDAQVSTRPIIGCYISGVQSVKDPAVWAGCLRFLYCSAVKDRAIMEDGSFLLVVFPLAPKDAERVTTEFYEVSHRAFEETQPLSFGKLISNKKNCE
eukprot:m.75970 g.75970  ORF g.75970 m.75970 type:complete len:319 (+) comp12534_c0_seq1:232-1188(+)